MDDPIGSLCIVLHCHLPYVLHHGRFPHGEAWLHEAAAETYLPLLDMIGETALHKARPALTIGLTPVLLEQLSHPRFKEGLVAYLNERIERSGRDRADFERRGEAHFAFLAERWGKWYSRRLEHFERIGRDIAREFAARAGEGHIQLLTSNATHAYMPLLLHDEMIAAQLKCGKRTTERHLGIEPRGIWLPECGYRPETEEWSPAVLGGAARYRRGLELFLADAGLTHFFVESHLVRDARPLGTTDRAGFRTVGDAQLHWDLKRGWNSPLEPVGVSSRPGPPACYAIARHPSVSEQVWSGIIGYPGAGEYLEFHRKHEEYGLRYHRVTDQSVSLGEKLPYEPDDIYSKLYEHTQHFCHVVRNVLLEHRDKTGRQGVCVAAFDAELFGHWWFEGPQFLRDVIFTLAHERSVRLATTDEVLRDNPPDKVVRLPEGSWGENGDHTAWLNDSNRWMWEIEYRAEDRMLRMIREFPWRTDPALAETMKRAGRELLLLQASDWEFVIHSQGAVDYGIQRFSGHATRFERAAQIAEEFIAGRPPGPLEQTQIAEMDAHDCIFPEIDLNWWTSPRG